MEAAKSRAAAPAEATCEAPLCCRPVDDEGDEPTGVGVGMVCAGMVALVYGAASVPA